MQMSFLMLFYCWKSRGRKIWITNLSCKTAQVWITSTDFWFVEILKISIWYKADYSPDYLKTLRRWTRGPCTINHLIRHIRLWTCFGIFQNQLSHPVSLFPHLADKAELKSWGVVLLLTPCSFLNQQTCC